MTFAACPVACDAAGTGSVSLQFRLVFSCFADGELLSWGGTDGHPEAGCQMLPLQANPALSCHLR